jgi:ATP-dependent phosphofructokinase / diphosphate-dependent phosphofructokinase
MLALKSSKIVSVPLAQAIKETKFVPLDSDIVLSARDLGISFGDE